MTDEKDTGGPQSLRENDICTWHWIDEKTGHIGGDPYHCKARKGIFHNGELLDLFWMNIGSHFKQEGWSQSRSGANSVPLDKIIVEVVANIEDLTEIHRGKEIYYTADDVVDLRNPNSSSAPVYVKTGAKRDAKVIRDLIIFKMEKAERDIDSANRQITHMTELLALVNAGDLENVYF